MQRGADSHLGHGNFHTVAFSYPRHGDRFLFRASAESEVSAMSMSASSS